MSFTQTEITLYDPQNRGLDLVKELAPFYQSSESWSNSTITGSYLSCSEYIITRRLSKLNLMRVTKIEETESVSGNSFELILSAGMAVQKGYTFSESELCFLKEISNNTNIIFSPDLPDIPIYDSIREQFDVTKRALECFK